MGNIYPITKICTMLAETPIVAVLGCTGTGKSKLAIELAKKFDGEIISADSMQVYKGLDIVTNKVTTQEQNEAHHHCIDIIEPLSRYTVVDFQNQALPIIQDIKKRHKLPIIVGGTNYYIESLLWEVLVLKKGESSALLFENDRRDKSHLFPPPDHVSPETAALFLQKITADSFADVSGATLHKSLAEIDPVVANTVHPEDKRKVIRALQVYQQHGCLYSDILKEQRSQNGGSSLGGPLRFKKAAMLWLQCDKEVLVKRLDARVDEMIERGLLSELLDFHKSYNEKRISNENPLYTEGIFQSIGFKEFHNYLVLPDAEKSSEKGSKILEKAIEDMKLVTRQYARRQTKWIANRFLRKQDRICPPVYGLSTTDLDKWNDNVLKPAVEIVQSLLEDKTPTYSPIPPGDFLEDVKVTNYCEVCEKLFVGQRTWEIHLKSKRHHKRKASVKRTQEKSLSVESSSSSSSCS